MTTQQLAVTHIHNIKIFEKKLKTTADDLIYETFRVCFITNILHEKYIFST